MFFNVLIVHFIDYLLLFIDNLNQNNSFETSNKHNEETTSLHLKNKANIKPQNYEKFIT